MLRGNCELIVFIFFKLNRFVFIISTFAFIGFEFFISAFKRLLCVFLCVKCEIGSEKSSLFSMIIFSLLNYFSFYGKTLACTYDKRTDGRAAVLFILKRDFTHSLLALFDKHKRLSYKSDLWMEYNYLKFEPLALLFFHLELFHKNIALWFSSFFFNGSLFATHEIMCCSKTKHLVISSRLDVFKQPAAATKHWT